MRIAFVWLQPLVMSGVGRRAILVPAIGAAAGCTVGPNYLCPATAVPARSKEGKEMPRKNWANETPIDTLDRGA